MNLRVREESAVRDSREIPCVFSRLMQSATLAQIQGTCSSAWLRVPAPSLGS